MSDVPPPYGATDEKTGYPPQQGGQYPPAQGGQYPPPQGGQYPPPQGGQYPPPQGGQYPPQQGYGQAQQTTIITTQPTVIAGGVLRFSEFPMQITCPHCQAQVVTTCNYVDGTAVWVIALLICLFGGWVGCCLIPFCINGLKDVNHICPNCTRMVGCYRRM
ncbi:cell death-inducing p53-target protein 1 homolog [Hydractinia symbiolongicarpus]|uniref:cell death-inducing p53-target protein 1 homolog n=1 Tax=Hydractinia symbiolongicarpus TaxID=13093 RepID=UPI00254CECAA|nr:cell death-inducing p53-target protein 1 homolog [Hydractinia symbiolongicarpus]